MRRLARCRGAARAQESSTPSANDAKRPRGAQSTCVAPAAMRASPALSTAVAVSKVSVAPVSNIVARVIGRAWPLPSGLATGHRRIVVREEIEQAIDTALRDLLGELPL